VGSLLPTTCPPPVCLISTSDPVIFYHLLLLLDYFCLPFVSPHKKKRMHPTYFFVLYVESRVLSEHSMGIWH
jgi:hypothetical protein